MDRERETTNICREQTLCSVTKQKNNKEKTDSKERSRKRKRERDSGGGGGRRERSYNLRKVATRGQ
jgi:hypothetical protein